MQDTTYEVLKASLKADASISPARRAQILGAIRRGGEEAAPAAPPTPRIMRRIEAARVLGRSLRAVDILAEQGILERVRLPGRVRAAGFRERDVFNLVQG